MSSILQSPFDRVQELGFLVNIERIVPRIGADSSHQGVEFFLIFFASMRFILLLHKGEQPVNFQHNFFRESNNIPDVKPVGYHSFALRLKN